MTEVLFRGSAQKYNFDSIVQEGMQRQSSRRRSGRILFPEADTSSSEPEQQEKVRFLGTASV